jgi:hypothetical protein
MVDFECEHQEHDCDFRNADCGCDIEEEAPWMRCPHEDE